MRQFIQFITSTLAWAAVCRLFLEFLPVHPVAIGVVWMVGFVWMTGYIASGPRDADHLMKVWLGMLAGLAVVAGIGAVILS